ncbi:MULTISPECIES: hypothetical protein [Cyanophyceae]|uniref:hypothetical protein n=1 Tax=Cyanophyceae TaxID=3028117 RepID=UPI00168527EF|nr:hypothetical protein [Trichocoleus sp. FACHB-69]MBD1931786.1 hypothetical protein [Trichocoleus sp. FACHB-69]
MRLDQEKQWGKAIGRERSRFFVETNLVFHSQSYPFPPFQRNDWAGSDRPLKKDSDHTYYNY